MFWWHNLCAFAQSFEDKIEQQNALRALLEAEAKELAVLVQVERKTVRLLRSIEAVCLCPQFGNLSPSLNRLGCVFYAAMRQKPSVCGHAGALKALCRGEAIVSVQKS